MPKKKPREVTGFEKELVELLDTVAPGGIELSRTKKLFGGESGFRVTFQTRSTVCDYLDDDLAEGIAVATEDLKSGDEDPVRPMWHRLSRFQREAVTRLLDMMAAKHMARAARAKIGAGGNDHAEFALSDAFHAALIELRREHDEDEAGLLLPGTPKLEAEAPQEQIHVAMPRKPKKPPVA